MLCLLCSEDEGDLDPALYLPSPGITITPPQAPLCRVGDGTQSFGYVRQALYLPSDKPNPFFWLVTIQTLKLGSGPGLCFCWVPCSLGRKYK